MTDLKTTMDESLSRVSRKGGRRTVRSLDRSGGAGSDRFLRHNPHARPPAEHAAAAPSRRDVPLFDPCCGQLSAGAEAALGTAGRRGFIEFHHVASGLRVPSSYGRGDGPQTPRWSSVLSPDTADDKAWNSRRPSGAAFRARLGGATGAEEMRAVAAARTPRTSGVLLEEDIGMQDPPRSDTRHRQEDARRRHVYTSSTQRSYQEVNWDAKLPRRFKAPPTTLEKMADPVGRWSSAARYPSAPQPWQSMGGDWERQQIRPRIDVQRPVSFCSPKSGQIPLYSGFIGSENQHRIDNRDEHFQPTTVLRKTIPQYTPTARRTTIPGYAGKGVYANADVALPTLSLPGLVALRSPSFGHKAPLSKMVTTVSPYNPFLVRRERPHFRCDAGGGKNK